VAHENAEDLAADFIVGRSLKHGHLHSRDAFSIIKPQRVCRMAADMHCRNVSPFSVRITQLPQKTPRRFPRMDTFKHGPYNRGMRCLPDNQFWFFLADMRNIGHST
jgi:hypothetical protein